MSYLSGVSGTPQPSSDGHFIQLKEDYEAYLEVPSTTTYQALMQDIEALQKNKSIIKEGDERLADLKNRLEKSNQIKVELDEITRNKLTIIDKLKKNHLSPQDKAELIKQLSDLSDKENQLDSKSENSIEKIENLMKEWTL